MECAALYKPVFFQKLQIKSNYRAAMEFSTEKRDMLVMRST